MYADGEYDLAGFAVGVADKANLLGAERVSPNDAIIAIASSGIHSNGYSLARRVIETEMNLSLTDTVESLNATVGETLLTPTKIYTSCVRSLIDDLEGDVHALCHVTGGGIPENLPRVLPEGVNAIIDGSRPWPAIFKLIAEGGPVELGEMRRTFNLGVGMLAVVQKNAVQKALASLKEAGEDAWLIGHLQENPGTAEVIYEGDPEGNRA